MFDNFRRFGRICSVISVGSVRFGWVIGFIHSRSGQHDTISHLYDKNYSMFMAVTLLNSNHKILKQIKALHIFLDLYNLRL